MITQLKINTIHIYLFKKLPNPLLKDKLVKPKELSRFMKTFLTLSYLIYILKILHLETKN